MVFYLKYRPQTLPELDNRTVREQLERFLSKLTIPHAFLFTGSKGTGKTSTARIIAKSINCLKPSKPNQACGKCAVCTSIANGINLDVLEIDAASNRGIDEIRDLREKIRLAPLSLKYKVYIIDEVHMLTSEAFNALLKTLEEPPAHAIFILATTEAHKLPDTIISRCVRIEFHKAAHSEILYSLKRVAAGEKLHVEDDALDEIAQFSEGSFRDATKILEELSLTNKTIKLSDVKAILGGTDVIQIDNFLKFLQEKNTPKLFEQIRQLDKEGKNLRQFFISILKKLEAELIAKVSGGKSNWPVSELKSALQLLSQAFMQLKTSVLPTLPFELAVAEYCLGVVSEPNNDNRTVNISATNVTQTAVSDSSVAPVLTKWPQIIEKLKSYNHSIAGVMRSCKPVSFTGNILTIETAYKFHADRLNDPKAKEKLVGTVKEMLGQDKLTINITIKKR